MKFEPNVILIHLIMTKILTIHLIILIHLFILISWDIK
jgi:hypothetical protein